MPIYEYYCVDCHQKFELLTSYANSSAVVACPACQGARVRKLFSVFARTGRGSDGDGYEAGDYDDYEENAGGCSCGGACSCGGH